MKEERVLRLVDSCIEAASYVNDSNNFVRRSIKDSVVIPADLWAQLVMELRPAELIYPPTSCGRDICPPDNDCRICR